MPEPQTAKVPETTAEEAVPNPPAAEAVPVEAAAPEETAPPAESAIPNTLPGQYWVQLSEVRFLPSDRMMPRIRGTALINPKYSNTTRPVTPMTPIQRVETMARAVPLPCLPRSSSTGQSTVGRITVNKEMRNTGVATLDPRLQLSRRG